MPYCELCARMESEVDVLIQVATDDDDFTLICDRCEASVLERAGYRFSKEPCACQQVDLRLTDSDGGAVLLRFESILFAHEYGDLTEITVYRDGITRRYYARETVDEIYEMSRQARAEAHQNVYESSHTHIR